MSFCCIRSWKTNTGLDQSRTREAGPQEELEFKKIKYIFFKKSVRGQGCDVGVVLCHLVEDIPLAAQVQVRQNTGRPDVGDGQTGLRDAGRNQGGLPLTETRKKVRELGEPT